MKVHVLSIKFKRPVLAICVAIGMTVASVGLIAAPAYALTLRTITNVHTGNILNSSGVVGNVVGGANPVPTGYFGSWYFDKLPTGTNLYLIHPENDTSLCLTASTTQNLDKIETCVSAANQEWYDYLVSGSQYNIYSADGSLPDNGSYLGDPSSSHGNHAVNNTGTSTDDLWTQD